VSLSGRGIEPQALRSASILNAHRAPNRSRSTDRSKRGLESHPRESTVRVRRSGSKQGHQSGPLERARFRPQAKALRAGRAANPARPPPVWSARARASAPNTAVLRQTELGVCKSELRAGTEVTLCRTRLRPQTKPPRGLSRSRSRKGLGRALNTAIREFPRTVISPKWLSNAALERPPRSLSSATRAHTLFLRSRRTTTGASRPAPSSC
jgi:hypothetical protein